MSNDEPSTQDAMLGLGLILAAGFLAYWFFFGGVRAEISRCIATAAEADRSGTQALGTSLRRMQLDVDRADEVTITRKSHIRLLA